MITTRADGWAGRRPCRALVLVVTVAVAASCSVAGVDRRSAPATTSAPVAPTTAAAAPTTTAPAAPPPVPLFDQVVLTPDGWDGYQLDASPDRVSVSAPSANSGGNLRAVYLPRGRPEAVDEQVCATWTADVGDEVQEGLALRVHQGAGGGRAITVTKNVWAYAGWHLNVHLWGDKGTYWERMQIAEFDLGWAAVVQNQIQGLPWRVCARVEGALLSVKLWPAAQPEPAWTDEVHVDRVTVPEGWRGAGRVGWYAGHLKAGNFLVYDRIDAAVLT